MYHLKISSFTVELVSNASFDYYPNNTISSFKNFLPEKINLDGEWEVAITELSYPSLYQNLPCTKTEGKFFYLDEATPDTKPSDYYTLDPGLYPSISDIVIEMNRTIQEREKYEKTPIMLHVNKISKRISLSVPNQNSLLVDFSADLCHVFGCEEAVYGMGVFMSGAVPHFPKFPYDIVRIHTLMIYIYIYIYIYIVILLKTILWVIQKLLFYDASRLYKKLRMEISSQRDNTFIIKIF